MIQVSVIMGSISDDGIMKEACNVFESFGVSYEKKVLSAHRTPDALTKYVNEAVDRGVKVFIAAAGGAAHLPGVIAAFTTVPVIGVPIKSKALNGLDSLLSIAQMPSGIPVASMAIDGAKNAALYSISILAVGNSELNRKLLEFRKEQEKAILNIEF